MTIILQVQEWAMPATRRFAGMACSYNWRCFQCKLE